MVTLQHFNANEDIPGHEDISHLLRTILQGDPLMVAHGEAFVMVSGPNWHFTFTKTADGYTLTKSACKS